jgi:hypothetical protein
MGTDGVHTVVYERVSFFSFFFFVYFFSFLVGALSS